MTIPRLALALALLNLALLAYVVGAPSATAQGPTPVLRGRALEIVDDQGRVRATISVVPATPATATAKAYPKTVILRLIDAHGRPGVKVTASANGDGREQLVKP